MLTPLLPARLQPYAKAVIPFVLTIIAILGHYFGTGEFDRGELAIALTGAASALVSLIVPNIRDSYDVNHPAA